MVVASAHTRERAVLALLGLAALAGVFDAVAARVSLVLQHADRSALSFVTQSNTKCERAGCHRGLLLAG